MTDYTRCAYCKKFIDKEWAFVKMQQYFCCPDCFEKWIRMRV